MKCWFVRNWQNVNKHMQRSRESSYVMTTIDWLWFVKILDLNFKKNLWDQNYIIFWWSTNILFIYEIHIGKINLVLKPPSEKNLMKKTGKIGE